MAPLFLLHTPTVSWVRVYIDAVFLFHGPSGAPFSNSKDLLLGTRDLLHQDSAMLTRMTISRVIMDASSWRHGVGINPSRRESGLTSHCPQIFPSSTPTLLDYYTAGLILCSDSPTEHQARLGPALAQSVRVHQPHPLLFLLNPLQVKGA